MKFRFGIPLVLAVLTLTSCASFTEEECAYSDWELVGRQDGLDGAPLTKFQNYVRQCGKFGTPPDSIAYNRGREDGLKLFCTPVGVYEAGLEGRGEAAQCGGSRELVRISRAAKNYAIAQSLLARERSRYDSLFVARRNIRRDIDRIDFLLSRRDLSEKERRELRRDLRFALNRLEDVDRTEFQLRFRLRDIEREVDQARYELSAVEAEFDLRRGPRF